MSDQKSNRDCLSHLPSELLEDIFHYAHESSQPLTSPLSKSLLPFQRRQLFRSIEVHSYKSLDNLCAVTQTHSSVLPCIKKLEVDIKFNRMTMWDTEEAEDPGFPSDATIERFLERLSNVQTVGVSGSTRITLLLLSPIVSSSLARLRNLDITSTLHSISDPFSPSVYDALQHCPEVFSLTLNISPARSIDDRKAQPRLLSKAYSSKISKFQLIGPLGDHETSIRQLLSTLDSLTYLSLFDTSETSSFIYNLLGSIPTPQKLITLAIGCQTEREVLVYGDFSNKAESFTSLTNICLLSHFSSLQLEFYSSLYSLPIRSICFQLHCDLSLAELTMLVSGPTRHPHLLFLIFNHVDGKVGTRIEDVGKPHYDIENEVWAPYGDWILPEWTEEFSEEDFVTFIKMAHREGFVVIGTAVDAIGIESKREREYDQAIDYTMAEERRREKRVGEEREIA